MPDYMASVNQCRAAVRRWGGGVLSALCTRGTPGIGSSPVGAHEGNSNPVVYVVSHKGIRLSI